MRCGTVRRAYLARNMGLVSLESIEMLTTRTVTPLPYKGTLATAASSMSDSAHVGRSGRGRDDDDDDDDDVVMMMMMMMS